MRTRALVGACLLSIVVLTGCGGGSSRGAARSVARSAAAARVAALREGMSRMRAVPMVEFVHGDSSASITAFGVQAVAGPRFASASRHRPHGPSVSTSGRWFQ